MNLLPREQVSADYRDDIIRIIPRIQHILLSQTRFGAERVDKRSR